MKAFALPLAITLMAGACSNGNVRPSGGTRASPVVSSVGSSAFGVAKISAKAIETHPNGKTTSLAVHLPLLGDYAAVGKSSDDGVSAQTSRWRIRLQQAAPGPDGEPRVRFSYLSSGQRDSNDAFDELFQWSNNSVDLVGRGTCHQNVDVPMMMIRFPLRVGDAWSSKGTCDGRWEFRVQRTEVLVIGGLKVLCFVIERSKYSDPSRSIGNRKVAWFSPAIGLNVRWAEYPVGLKGAPDESAMELTSPNPI